MCTNSQKSYNIIKSLKTPEEVEKYFPGFMAITNCTEQQIPIPEDKRRCEIYYLGKKKKHAVKNQLTVNNANYIIHKSRYNKG